MSSPPKVSSAEPSPVDVFLRATLRSGLLDAPQLQQALNATPSAIRNDAQELANHMVKVGHLSRFQAHKLLQGVSIGLVLGPYHLLAQIGRGGMGAVYLARDTRNQGLVAVKVLPPKRAKAQERLLARFRREMEICQRVAHPNLTRTFEVGVHQDVNYIAMEYIPGKNLYRLVHERGPLDVPRAARLFAEVADGLEHAHEQGLIHRDLKPSNIIVTPADHAKVLDLGLALIQGEIAEERTIVGGQGYVVGTMDYLAPEQAEDPFNVDGRSDIYSLGATIYFTLVSQPPFPGGNALQKMLRHRTEEPVPLRSLQPSIPAGFETLVNRMMAKDPAQRFANAVELRAALQPWIGEIPIGAAVAPPRVAGAPPPPPPSSTIVAPPAPAKVETAPAAARPTAPPPAPPPAKVEAPPPAPRPPAPPPAVPTAEIRPAPPPPRPDPIPVAPEPVKVRAPAPVIPLAAPVEEPAVAPPAPAPAVASPLQDPRFVGGAETMKISRGALQAGALAFAAAEAAVPIAPLAAPPVPVLAAPAPSPPAANPFAFESIEASPPAPLFAPTAAVAVTPLTAAPTVAARPALDGPLPFWLDFLLPVGGAGLFLFIVWVMLLASLIR